MFEMVKQHYLGKKSVSICVLIALMAILLMAQVSAQEYPGGGGGGAPVSNESETVDDSSVQYDSAILEEFEKSTEIVVIVRMRDTSGIVIESTDTEEEEIVKDQLLLEHFSSKRAEVLASFTDAEFRLKRLFTLNGFSAYVTRAGFEKLIASPHVESVFLSGVSSVGAITVPTVDKPLQSINGSAPYSPEILEAFETSTELPISGHVRGSGTEEEELVRKRIDAVLSTLSDTESKSLINEGEWFHGNVTRETFNKLAYHPEITKIFLNLHLYQIYTASGTSTEEGVQPQNESEEETPVEPPTNTSPTIAEPEPLPEPEEVEVEPELSLFGKLIQFLKSLFGVGE